MIAILAIDLGKFKSVYCAFDPGTPDAARFGSVCTNVETLEKLLRDEAPALVVFETCTIAGWVGELCQRLGVNFAIANPNAEAWRWKNVKRKTDRDDALKLARLAAGGELPVTPHVPAAVRQQRALLKYKQQVIGQRVRAQNHIRASAEAQGRRLANGAKAWTKAGMQLLDEWSKPLAECGALELWRGELHQAVQWLRHSDAQEAELDRKLDALALANASTQRLQTIPGVGRKTAEVVANYLHDARRFAKAGEVSSYAGLVPRQYQSGLQDRRGRISKCGPGLLRKALVEAAWCMLRYNAWAAALFQRLTKGQKTRRKAAIVAVARKLLVRCWGMLRHEIDWQEPVAAASPAA